MKIIKSKTTQIKSYIYFFRRNYAVLPFWTFVIFFFFTMSVSKIVDLSRGCPEGSLFNSYYIEVYRRALLHFLDCSTLPSILTLYSWALSKAASSTIFWVFGMTRPGIERQSPGPLTSTLLIRPIPRSYNVLADIQTYFCLCWFVENVLLCVSFISFAFQ